jgi:hypothetical protein
MNCLLLLPKYDTINRQHVIPRILKQKTNDSPPITAALFKSILNQNESNKKQFFNFKFYMRSNVFISSY